MSTQRFELPCSFSQKDSSGSQPVKPVVSVSLEKPIEARSYTLKNSISLPPLATTGQGTFLEGRRGEKNDEFWGQRAKNLKRSADEILFHDDGSCTSRAKRKRGGWQSDDFSEGGGNLSLGQLGSGNFLFHPSFEVPTSVSLIAGFDQSQVSVPVLCSGEDNRTLFKPSELNLPKKSLLDSAFIETPKLGDQHVETSPGGPVQETSVTRSSPGKDNLTIRLTENPTILHERGNSSGPCNANVVADYFTGKNGEHEEHEGFELISLIVACVEAITMKDIRKVNHFIAKLGGLASPKGSTLSRLIAYFIEALAIRIARMWPLIYHITPPRALNQYDDDNGTALRFLNQISPIPWFIHFTANEILLRGFEGEDRIHIIDFDIKQGVQWPSFFQSLACRNNRPSHIRITGISESKQELIETGDRLAGFAEALCLPFKFHPVVDRLEDVRLWMLHVKERECVAVNCIFQLHKMLYDGSEGVLGDFLGLIRSTNPKTVILAEQEAEHNYNSLNLRLYNSLRYYSAIFDSIDISLPVDILVRIKIEEMYGREIRNIIACEGRERLERHERFGTWSKLMKQGGFRCIGINDRELIQSQMLLKMYSCDKFQVEKQEHDQYDSAALTLSWLDQPLYTVSAWSPIDVIGSSSSCLQPS
ncbi:Scarecrow-like protein 28 [Heracleum sosnowskyi]|uniref:Scarecrow-like protein 28 n=1 Tax=Heracleum sosnowskyi TaxID=360622 RepID=A0AAD8LYW5_9APIA|nr:Scarecrow-like protein 28 [Heracleum sosnowskyi]